MSTSWAKTRRCASPHDTEAFGEELAREFKAGDILLLEGPLGAGKTCLTRGLARGLGANPDAVLSPTFSIVRQVSGGRLLLHHIDLYRLESEAQLQFVGVVSQRSFGACADAAQAHGAPVRIDHQTAEGAGRGR